MPYCELCDLGFLGEPGMFLYEKHIKSHLSRRLVEISSFQNGDSTLNVQRLGWFCKICGFKFHQSDELREHIDDAHEGFLDYSSALPVREGDVFTKAREDIAFNKLLIFSFASASESDATVENLREHTWHKNRLAAENMATNQCPICFMPLQFQASRSISCRHEFHESCIVTHVSFNGRFCPLCRELFYW
ncbi:RING finger domain-containing protein [Endozoicomonas lisbonensis]|uniref:RING-type domain-containing protein n=1 Tax=Endozoicomonas lisbonensis TaxID=3120522 RepID=A0ABV2SKF7_9GAMM